MTPESFVHTPPDWKAAAPAWPTGLPLSGYFGKPIAWAKDYAPAAVFIGQTSLPDDGEVYLFGVRYDLKHRTDIPATTGSDPGYFVNYVVVHLRQDAPVAVHQLAQRRSATYQSGHDISDAVFASDMKKRDRSSFSLSHEPRWKPSEAQWALQDGLPMTFVAQFELPENDVTREYLTYDEALFLFWHEDDGAAVFKLTTQSTDLQTAEEHYRAEARRMRKRATDT